MSIDLEAIRERVAFANRHAGNHPDWSASGQGPMKDFNDLLQALDEAQAQLEETKQHLEDCTNENIKLWGRLRVAKEALKNEQECLINVGATCAACGDLLLMGGWWGWHKEGFRAGPFCNQCTDKPSIERQIDDPSIGGEHPDTLKESNQ